MSEDITPELSCNVDARRLLLSGKIDETKAHDFREALLDLNSQDPTRPITVYIDTYGGSSYAMFAMHDVMKLVTAPIHTIGIGKVMSAGVLLLAAGDSRHLAPNTSVMLHEVSTEIQGEVTRMKIELSHVTHLQNRMYELLSDYTGQPVEVIQQDLTNDKYMTAAEAVDYGIADSLLELRTA